MKKKERFYVMCRICGMGYEIKSKPENPLHWLCSIPSCQREGKLNPDRVYFSLEARARYDNAHKEY
jgi:hypothetical protein